MKLVIYFLISFFLFSFSSKSQVEPKEILIRIFKYDKTLEVWCKTEDTFYLDKTYQICMLSGVIGPKRKEGDLQVPEGFYHIKDFNPYSKYKKGMGISYPNKSDSLLSPFRNLGGSIYIHGECVSVGCIAIENRPIEELYQICRKMDTKIQVHIFPINFSCPESQNFLSKKIQDKPDLFIFEKNLEEGFLYFEKNKLIPQINVNESGYYEFN